MRPSLRNAIEKKAAQEAGIPKTQRMYRARAQGYELGKIAAAAPAAAGPGLGMKILQGGATLALGGAIIGAGNLAFGALERGLKGLTEGKDKAKAVSEMLRVNPNLGKEDKTKVLQAFDTVWRFNPEVAKDPLASASFVQKYIDYGAVTTDEVKKMVDMRKAMSDAAAKERGFAMSELRPGALF